MYNLWNILTLIREQCFIHSLNPQCLRLVDFFDYLNSNMYKWKVKGIFKITVRNSTVNILWVKIYTIKTYYFIVAVSYSPKTISSKMIHRYSSWNKISHDYSSSLFSTQLKKNYFASQSFWVDIKVKSRARVKYKSPPSILILLQLKSQMQGQCRWKWEDSDAEGLAFNK